MRSYNYVIVPTHDFDHVVYSIRAIDFDQQSYEGKFNVYRPQFFKENFKMVDLVSEKFEKMSQFLNLDSTQEITIKAIMSSSSKKMKESKDKLMINKEALRILNPNDVNFMKDLSLLSEEIGALTSEQSMLFGLSRERINNELNDDQRKLVKSFMGARSESHPKSRKSKFKKRIMSDKRDKRWNKKRRDKD